MFGVGALDPYRDYVIEWLGGTHLGLITTLVTRIIVGIGWFGMFRQVGKTPWTAFIPIYGEFQAFRIVYSDFSFAAIFGATSFVAWVGAVGVEHPLVTAFSVVNVVLWWIMAILASFQFQLSVLFGVVYGLIPWAGSLIFGWSSLASYQGPWSSDPNSASNKRKKKSRSKKGRS